MKSLEKAKKECNEYKKILEKEYVMHNTSYYSDELLRIIEDIYEVDTMINTSDKLIKKCKYILKEYENEQTTNV